MTSRCKLDDFVLASSPVRDNIFIGVVGECGSCGWLRLVGDATAHDARIKCRHSVFA
jgi:hypothetical protein